MTKFYFFVFLSLFYSTILSGQDLHYTQFQMSPLTMNPALAGAFSGSVRVGGIYRDQWFHSIDLANGSLYRSPSFYADAPIIRGLREQDWVGIGAVFINDQQGYLTDDVGNPPGTDKASITTSGLIGGASYHFALDEDQKTVLTLGAQYGTLSKALKNSGYVFYTQLLDNPINEQVNFSEKGESYQDISAGLLLTGHNQDNIYRFGISMLHINQPRITLNETKETISSKIVAHAMYELPINERIKVIPALLFQNVKTSSEIVIQGMGSLMLNPETRINAGLGYRFGDGVQLLGGVDYKSLRAGISYDITLSSLSPSGSFEIAVSYIAKIYKRPKITPVIFCPRF